MPKRLHENETFKKGRFLIKDIDIKLDNNDEVVFQYWDKPDTAMIVPVTPDNEVIFVKEYMSAFDEIHLGLPKGRIEKGEVSMEIANKELQEEIGYRAQKLDKIGTFTTIPGYVSGITHAYLAHDLIESELVGDEQWELEIVKHPLDDFESLIDNGTLTETRVISSLYEARRFFNK